jgi:glycosyltransferase involved in cell wall biosynthesis
MNSDSLIINKLGTDRLMLFDLNPSGHHGGYLHHLARYWREHRLPGELILLVSPDFLTLHPGLLSNLSNIGMSDGRIRLIPISEAEHQRWQAGRSGLAKARIEWQLMTQYAVRERVGQVLLMYFDNLQPAFVLSGTLPFAVSGILFRPSFHYADWGQGPTTWAQRLQFLRKAWLLRMLVSRPTLRHLFCLDPFAVAPLNAWAGRELARHLPDPVPTRPVSEAEQRALRHRLGIEAGRRIVLVFGQLDDRKGIDALLLALSRLPNEVQRTWCLLLVGPLHDSIRDGLPTQIAQVGPVQVVQQHTFVQEPDIQPYIAVADLVAVLYRQHIGMSAVLVRAAAAGRPVLASDYGLLGKLVTTKQLGRAVNATDDTAIAEALTQFGRGEWSANPEEMRNFAEQNQAERFAEVIVTTLIGNLLPEPVQETLVKTNQ